MKKLQREVSQLKSSLAQQAPLIQAVGPAHPFVPMTTPMTSQMPVPQSADQMASVSMTTHPVGPVAMTTPMTSQAMAMTSPIRYYSTPYQGQPFAYQQQQQQSPTGNITYIGVIRTKHPLAGSLLPGNVDVMLEHS